MRVNKVLGAYLIDKGQEISESKEPLCPLFISELMQIFAKAESKNNKEDKPEPEECLTCELLNMLGLPSGVLDSIGEHTSSTNPQVKIKIKKVSSASDLDKLLKELKSGGTIDLNTANDKLGEIFDLNSIQHILKTEFFQNGGNLKPTKMEDTYEDWVARVFPEISQYDKAQAAYKEANAGNEDANPWSWTKDYNEEYENIGNFMNELYVNYRNEGTTDNDQYWYRNSGFVDATKTAPYEGIRFKDLNKNHIMSLYQDYNKNKQFKSGGLLDVSLETFLNS